MPWFGVNSCLKGTIYRFLCTAVPCSSSILLVPDQVIISQNKEQKGYNDSVNFFSTCIETAPPHRAHRQRVVCLWCCWATRLQNYREQELFEAFNLKLITNHLCSLYKIRSNNLTKNITNEPASSS